MLNVHQISATLKIIQSQLEENGGEVTPDIEEAFNKAFAARDEKLDALALLMKTADAEELVINAEIARLKSLKEQITAKGEYLEKMVKDLLPVGESWNGGLHKFSYSKCPPSVEVINESEIPETYFAVELVSRVDKKTLGIDLKGGAIIPGVKLVTDKYTLKLK